MEIDLDTFLVTVYCTVDDLYQAFVAPAKPRRRGHQPEMADSEVLTLALVAQWQQDRSESAFLRYVRHHWRGYFPRLLSQSAFNRRVRDLAGVLAFLGPLIGRETTRPLAEPPAYEVLDGVPVPVMRRCRGIKHRLFADEAAIGHGGSDEDWYYGVELLTIVNAAGLISGFVIGPATTDERWLAEALLRWRQDPTAPVPTRAQLAPLLGPSHKAEGARVGPTGPIGSRWGAGERSDLPCLADLGFRGRAWAHHWRADYGTAVLTKADYANAAATERRKGRHMLSSLRQVIETTNQALTDVFGLTFPRARTAWGVLARVAAKIAAFNAALSINHLFNRPTFAIFQPFE